MRASTVAMITALLVGAPALAQDPGMPMPHETMQQCMAMMGGPHPEMLLHMRDSLSLSADQVSRLEALRDQSRDSATPHMQPAMQAHMAAAALLEAAAPDFTAYEARLREAADHMILAHPAMVRTTVGAREVLTAAQRSKLDTLLPAMMQMMHGGEHAMAGGQRPQEHGPGGMMMMHCMMMGAAGQEHGGH